MQINFLILFVAHLLCLLLKKIPVDLIEFKHILIVSDKSMDSRFYHFSESIPMLIINNIIILYYDNLQKINDLHYIKAPI